MTPMPNSYAADALLRFETNLANAENIARGFERGECKRNLLTRHPLIQRYGWTPQHHYLSWKRSIRQRKAILTSAPMSCLCYLYNWIATFLHSIHSI
jgi:hypothetical protein